MTNIEMIQSMDLRELAAFLCGFIECADCPGSEWCRDRHKGLIDWLKMELPDDGGD